MQGKKENKIRKRKKAKAERKKEQEKIAAAMATSKDSGGSSDDSNQKVPKDLSHIECFRCKEFGHYSTSKDCPLYQEKKAEANVNGTWGGWEDYAGIFTTIKEEQQGSVYMTKGLSPTEVLLDNQANISIVNPRLLKNVRQCSHQIRVKGVGGTQLIVDKV